MFQNFKILNSTLKAPPQTLKKAIKNFIVNGCELAANNGALILLVRQICADGSYDIEIDRSYSNA